MKIEDRVRRLIDEYLKARDDQKDKIVKILVKVIEDLLSCPDHVTPSYECERCRDLEDLRSRLRTLLFDCLSSVDLERM